MAFENVLTPFASQQPMQKKVRLWFLDNTWVEFNVAHDFNLVNYMKDVKLFGCIQTLTFYCPAHLIKCIIMLDDPNISHGFDKPANAPTTGTTQ